MYYITIKHKHTLGILWIVITFFCKCFIVCHEPCYHNLIHYHHAIPLIARNEFTGTGRHCAFMVTVWENLPYRSLPRNMFTWWCHDMETTYNQDSPLKGRVMTCVIVKLNKLLKKHRVTCDLRRHDAHVISTSLWWARNSRPRATNAIRKSQIESRNGYDMKYCYAPSRDGQIRYINACLDIVVLILD